MYMNDLQNLYLFFGRVYWVLNHFKMYSIQCTYMDTLFTFIDFRPLMLYSLRITCTFDEKKKTYIGLSAKKPTTRDMVKHFSCQKK